MPVNPMLTRRSLIAGAAALSAGAALAGCSGGTGNAAGSSAAQNSASQLTIAMSPSNEPASGFDPCIDWGCGEHVHEPLIQSTLVRTNKDMEFVNDLATGYECSNDLLTWTFTLRDDAVFSDGEPLTAGDVAFTINTIRDSASAQADLSMVREAVATSDTVVEIRLTKPYNVLLYTLANLGIVPEHAYGDDYGEKPVGSGRYMLERWDKGQQAVFVANPRYYGDTPAIERFTVVFMEEDAARAAVMSKEVDVAYTTAIMAGYDLGDAAKEYTLSRYKTVDSRGVNLPVIASGATVEDGGVMYEAGNDVTRNLEVRRAINHAVDREALIKDVLSGYGTAAYSIGDGMPWANADMKVDRDVDAAKREMEDAGWSLNDEGVYERDGLTCELTLWYATGDGVRQAMANAFASQMAKVGIKITPQGADWDTIYTHQYADPVMWGWGSNSPSDVYELSYSAGTMNYARYASDMTDSYLDAALATATVEESYPYWQKSEWDGEDGIAPAGEATWVWFANVDHLYWVRKTVHVADQKLQPHGHGWSILNNVDTWSVD